MAILTLLWGGTLRQFKLYLGLYPKAIQTLLGVVPQGNSNSTWGGIPRHFNLYLGAVPQAYQTHLGGCSPRQFKFYLGTVPQAHQTHLGDSSPGQFKLYLGWYPKAIQVLLGGCTPSTSDSSWGQFPKQLHYSREIPSHLRLNLGISTSTSQLIWAFHGIFPTTYNLTYKYTDL